MLKLTDNPPLMLAGSLPLDDASQQWAIAYCRSRQEKALAWDLCRKRVPYFLPMAMRETFSGGRRRRNLYLVFESHLFFAEDEHSENRLAVLRTKRVVQVYEICQIEQLAFRRDIHSLEFVLRNASGKIELHPQEVKGERSQVTKGPLTGVEGVMFKADSKTMLWVGVAFMKAGIAIAINADQVKPIGDNA